MGSCSDATICFGIAFEEGYEFPWDSMEFDNDLEDWWLSVNNYEPPFQLWQEDENGVFQYVEENRHRSSEYYQHQRDWLKEHPLPVEEHRCGSYECYNTVLAVPNTTVDGDWEYPTEFNPKDLVISPTDLRPFEEFIDKYVPDAKEPKWLLFGFYG